MIQTPSKVDENNFHLLSDKWTFWAHLPDDIDWSVNSYKKIYDIKTCEETIAILETIPEIMVKNCMLFLMRDGIKPIWEDPQNRNGGCFSYKIQNKIVYEVWKDLCYVLVGNNISNRNEVVSNIRGITISPKKNFCIIKIWFQTCEFQNPAVITCNINGIVSQGCIFKKHVPEY
jgi:hypothetical protein